MYFPNWNALFIKACPDIRDQDAHLYPSIRLSADRSESALPAG